MTDERNHIRVRGRALEAVIYVGGKRKRLATGYFVGQEQEAEAVLRATEKLLDAPTSTVLPAAPAPATAASTVRELARAWVENRKSRGRKDWVDIESRLRLYLLPALGEVPACEVTEAMMMDWVQGLESAAGQDVEKLNPRYVRKIARSVRMLFKDGLKRGLLSRNPCAWDASDLPDASTSSRKVGEGFLTEQVERLIYDERIGEDRRMLYALEFLTGMRTGEAAARTWQDWEPSFLGNLGRIVAATSYDSKTRTMNETTKTGEEKWLPVHPTLADLLTAWKERGFERFFGRKPQPTDPIVPSRWAFRKRAGGRPYPVYRHHSASWRCFRDDLEKLEIPHQRHYESRSSFINLCEAGGATDDDVGTLTHAGAKRSKDLYRRVKVLWPKLCRAVLFIQVRRPDGTRTDPNRRIGGAPAAESPQEQPQIGPIGHVVDGGPGRLQSDAAVSDIRQAPGRVAAGNRPAGTADVPAAPGSVAAFIELAGQLARDAAARGDTSGARALLESALKALDLPTPETKGRKHGA